MIGLTLDTGALIAIERRERRSTLFVERARADGQRLTVPSAVVVEWWRGQRGPAARLLDSLHVEALDRELAEVAGRALAIVRGATAIDAIVMASAARRGDAVLTGDLDDLDALRAAFPGVRLLGIARGS